MALKYDNNEVLYPYKYNVILTVIIIIKISVICFDLGRSGD